jgi:peroxiredoxin
MKKIILSIMLIIPAVLFAQPGEYTIKGKIGKLNSPAMAYLSYRNAKVMVKDSSAITDGQFEFKGTVTDPIQASLIVNPAGPGMRGKLVRSLALYLEPGVIKISTPDSMANAKITGPKINTDNEKLKLALKSSDEKMKAFNAEYAALPPEKQKDSAVRAVLEVRYNAINEEKKSALLNFVHSNTGSLISLNAIKTLGGSIPDYTEVAPLFNNLSADVKNTTAGKEYAASLDKMKATMIGATAPEFVQNNADGKPVRLSDFRGKYLLVDFWASWCGPCRAENPNVVKSFNQYKDKGFTILGVSLDNETGRQKWLDAIQKDGLNWAQVTDLKYWDNEVAVLYGIRSIPQNLLLDPDGKIIAKNLRGKALEDKLAEVLKGK